MPTFRLVLEYDGTDFSGWQTQGDGTRTVQGAVEVALRSVTGADPFVMGAGRTDAGVHAEGQVASAVVETALDAATLRRAMNAVLPADVAVVEAALAAPDFHALRDACGKLYRYRVWNGPTRSPLRARTHHVVRAALDLEAMRRAAAPLVGRHDFRAFETRGSEHADPGRSTVRTLHAVTIEGEAGAEVRLDFEGEGFLRYMVRTLVGTLLEVGRGTREEAGPARVLAAGDRRSAGPTAPAAGLTLVRVRY